MPALDWIANPLYGGWTDVSAFRREATEEIRALHRAAGGPTRLVLAEGAARRLGLRRLAVKDESSRFGLNAFKGLGGLWAVFCALRDTLGPLSAGELRRDSRTAEQVFITATDGNHGKGVAWAAAYFGCEAHVYMPRGTVPARAQAVRDAGRAECTVTDMSYDECVRYAAALAEEKGWHLVQDTSWPGYRRIPLEIMRAYTTMLWEALDALGEKPTHVLLQAGVGSMAAAVCAGLAAEYGRDLPRIAVVEPRQVACIGASMRAGDGRIHPADPLGETVMAGLNCGLPCDAAWPFLRTFAEATLTCGDETAERGMRFLAGEGIVSGESGAAAAGVLDALCEDEDCRPLRERFGLTEDSVVLLFSTEGDTDPAHYRQVVG